MGTYGRRVLDAKTGHPIQVAADGAPVWHPIGITVDWDTVAALEDETTYLDKTVLQAGQKALRYGQVLVKDAGTGKWKPWASGALKRGETVILNQTVVERSSIPGVTNPTSDHPGVLDGGMCWKARIIAVDDPDGVAQAETATVVGTIAADGAGNVEVIVTAAGLTGSPKTILVAVANNDTASQVAAKIRAALDADQDVHDFFVVSGAGADVVLTKRQIEDNDPTLNIAIDNDTSTGLTAAPTSANTTAGSDGLDVETGPAFADLEAALPLLRYV